MENLWIYIKKFTNIAKIKNTVETLFIMIKKTSKNKNI